MPAESKREPIDDWPRRPIAVLVHSAILSFAPWAVLTVLTEWMDGGSTPVAGTILGLMFAVPISHVFRPLGRIWWIAVACIMVLLGSCLGWLVHALCTGDTVDSWSVALGYGSAIGIFFGLVFGTFRVIGRRILAREGGS